MKALAVLSTLVVAAPGLSRAAGSVEIDGDRVRLVNGATWGKSRSVWARGQSLVLVLSARRVRREVVRQDRADAVIREARLNSRNNRTQLELRLTRPAMDLLSRVQVREEGQDLVIGVLEDHADDR